jgi:predicted nuclease of restriction endonuclease-like (RecB) superfamily
MNFDFLSSQIKNTHSQLSSNAAKSVNIHLTLRNWLVGYFIKEFEQKGEDRAQYGSKLLQNLAKSTNIKGLTAPELSRCRQFYEVYHFFADILPIHFKHILPVGILGTMSQELKPPIFGSVTQEFNLPILGSVTQKLIDSQIVQNESYYVKLFSRISFTHFIELIKLEDENQRRFYEILTIKQTLSVRELEKQIATLAYQRVGLSNDFDLALNEIENKIIPENASDAIKSIYCFDFLNLPNSNLLSESEFETAILNHLEKFILELGFGFCFEARQKRLLIDDEYYFTDLVFYHRVLKCHVLIELKIDKFKHEYLSQLNSYVAYYNDKERREDDNPAIGILLCTEKGKQMVEYANAGMDQKLFVSKYLVELPNKEILSQFIEKEKSKI